ncbi:MAG: hypothetical protein U0Q12_24870 [Vicinamibacterales bacterium]
MNTRRRLVIGFCAVAIAGAVVVAGAMATPAPSASRSYRDFDPDRLAALELDMWQAYYAKERLRLFGDLVVSLREQFGYSWLDATRAAWSFARAAAWFGDATGDYERALPGLRAGYAIARARARASFDPAAVARAELAWWVARREPGNNAPHQVGALIAQQYALFYEVPVARVEAAGRLRAEAAALRDEGGAEADWAAVGATLTQAYRALRSSVAR